MCSITAQRGGSVQAVESDRLETERDLEDAGQSLQGESVDLADAVACPGSIEPAEVSYVGPAVSGDGDGRSGELGRT